MCFSSNLRQFYPVKQAERLDLYLIRYMIDSPCRIEKLQFSVQWKMFIFFFFAFSLFWNLSGYCFSLPVKSSILLPFLSFFLLFSIRHFLFMLIYPTLSHLVILHGNSIFLILVLYRSTLSDDHVCWRNNHCEI